MLAQQFQRFICLGRPEATRIWLILFCFIGAGSFERYGLAAVGVINQGTNQLQGISTNAQDSAEDPAIASDENPAPTSSRTPSIHPYSFLTAFEFWLCIIVLIFGAIVLVIEFFLIRGVRHNSEDILRICAVTLIVIGTLFAITAGFSAEQIAPAIGLFGTVAGYLLGRRSAEQKEERSSETGEITNR